MKRDFKRADHEAIFDKVATIDRISSLTVTKAVNEMYEMILAVKSDTVEVFVHYEKWKSLNSAHVEKRLVESRDRTKFFRYIELWAGNKGTHY